MNPITDLWRQLVRRRLWPVAILLVAALAAVPVLLAKDPEPAPPAPAPANTQQVSDSALAEEPIVAQAESAATAVADRKPLGERHDIFKPTKKAPKVKKADDEDKPEDSGGKSSEPKPDGGSSDGGGGGASPTPAPAPADPAPEPEPKTYPLYSLKVRFTVDEQSIKGYLPRRAPLPSAEEPLIIYLGLSEDKQRAVFLLDSTIQAVGDGECKPTPENCETVEMREGDTMFFDVVDAEGESTGDQFQLDLLDIHKKKTTDAGKAARSAKLAGVSSAAKARGVASGLGGSALRRLGVVGRTG